MTYFGPALDPPLGGSGRKTTTLVRDLEYFIHTKFHQNPSSGSGEEVENVNSPTDNRRPTTHDHNRSLCALQTILKGKRNAYFDFQNAGFIMSTNLVLLTAIYTHLYRQQIPLVLADDTFHLRWRHCHVQAYIYYSWRKPELENKSFSKKMDRWIIICLKVVSLLTNNDNSWSTYPICNRFRWHE